MSRLAALEKGKLREELRKAMGLPSYSLFEEILNALTHGIGAALAIVAIVLLPIFSPKEPLYLVCVSIYSATLFILYIISTMYHALGLCKAKKVFRVLDHCSIFLLIAGTYTPISLLIIGGSLGYILAISIWVVAIIGIVLNSIDLNKFAKLSMVCYIGMGWAVVFAFKPLMQSISTYQLTMLLIGGIAYTVGAIIYGVGKKVKYMHSLWHLFVLAGSIFHFFMVFDCIKNV